MPSIPRTGATPSPDAHLLHPTRTARGCEARSQSAALARQDQVPLQAASAPPHTTPHDVEDADTGMSAAKLRRNKSLSLDVIKACTASAPECEREEDEGRWRGRAREDVGWPADSGTANVVMVLRGWARVEWGFASERGGRCCRAPLVQYNSAALVRSPALFVQYGVTFLLVYTVYDSQNGISYELYTRTSVAEVKNR